MRYGIVYMGSKEKILHLIEYVFNREYNKKNLIDLFCGGLSVSSFALQRTRFNVYANDLNHYIISLYRDLLSNEPNFDYYKYDWVSRKHFEDVRDNPQEYPPWYVGYVLNIWSFGCNQKDYLYAKDLESDKKAIHYALVFDDFRFMKESETFKGFKISDDIRKVRYSRYKQKRISFMSKLKEFIKLEKKTQENASSPRLQQLERLEQMENISQMEHLNAVTRNKSKRSRLFLFNMDWKEFYDTLPKDVLENGFIYCDPPYENTKQYLFGSDFDYKEFWNWFRECPYPVYVSSYQAPEDIKPINFDFKAQLLDNGNANKERKAKKKYVQENIYWNGKGEPEPTFFDQLFNKN